MGSKSFFRRSKTSKLLINGISVTCQYWMLSSLSSTSIHGRSETEAFSEASCWSTKPDCRNQGVYSPRRTCQLLADQASQILVEGALQADKDWDRLQLRLPLGLHPRQKLLFPEKDPDWLWVNWQQNCWSQFVLAMLRWWLSWLKLLPWLWWPNPNLKVLQCRRPHFLRQHYQHLAVLMCKMNPKGLSLIWRSSFCMSLLWLFDPRQICLSITMSWCQEWEHQIMDHLLADNKSGSSRDPFPHRSCSQLYARISINETQEPNVRSKFRNAKGYNFSTEVVNEESWWLLLWTEHLYLVWKNSFASVTHFKEGQYEN